VQTSYTYEPFGSLSTSGSGTTNTIGYSGRETDGTGLFSYRSRYYDPQLQRFVSEDPIGLWAGDANLFAYVRNSPTRFRDPTGKFVILAGAVVVAESPAIAAAIAAATSVVAIKAGQAVAPYIADVFEAISSVIAASSLGGDDKGFNSEQEYREAMDEARRTMRDPTASARERSQAKRRLEELRRRSSKKHTEPTSRAERGKGVVNPATGEVPRLSGCLLLVESVKQVNPSVAF
jgi:RHS repeat-associated protein